MSGWIKKRRVMRDYDTTAGMYDRRYAEEQAAKIEAALKHVNNDTCKSVLDVGCGTGILFDYVADEARTLVGLDLSKKILLHAKQRSEKRSNVHLVQADADNMPLKSQSFTHVFALTLIQNAPDPKQTLKEIKRVAEEEATIVITGLRKIFSKLALTQLLENAGLKIEALEEKSLKCHVVVCTQ